MEMLKKVFRVGVVLPIALIVLVAVSAVLGMIVEIIGWAGGKIGLWDGARAALLWVDNLPFAGSLNGIAAQFNLNPAWIGYLLAMVILALFGFFSRRK